MGPAQHNKLLGGLTPDDFLKTYWQKKPLLIRQAFPDFKDLLSPDELAGLAMEPDCKARLVFEKGRKPWRVLHGPFEEQVLTGLPKTHWSLLVSRLNDYLDSGAALLELFNFIPRWRIDDLMVSFAPPHGTVGPHVDSYDVFLIQGMGRRSWQINTHPDLTMIQGVDLKVLQNFKPRQEWILETGDMLYLPPGVAHYGRALEDCLTYSVGFRAPSHMGILSDLYNTPSSWFSSKLTHSKGEEALYADPDLKPCHEPGLVDAKAIQSLGQMITSQLQDPDFLERFLLRHLTKTSESPVFAPKVTPQTLEKWHQKLAKSLVTVNHRFPISYTKPRGQVFHVAVGGKVWELHSKIYQTVKTLTSHQNIVGKTLVSLLPSDDQKAPKGHDPSLENTSEKTSGLGFLYQLGRCGAIHLREQRATGKIQKPKS